jgi:hypothetical protein
MSAATSHEDEASKWSVMAKSLLSAEEGPVRSRHRASSMRAVQVAL